MTAAQPDTPKPRRWFRFSLRTLLIVMLLLGVVFGTGSMAYEARRQRKVVADLEESGMDVEFSDEEPSMPELLDTGYSGRVISVRTHSLFTTSFNDVSPLAAFENLDFLDLSWTQVADVTPLAELENLEVLGLERTQVTDVSPLAGLKNLELLDLSGTNVTDQQVNDLQQALPDCEIIR